MKKLFLTGSFLLLATTLVSCQSIPVASSETQSRQPSATSSTDKQAISLQQLKDNRWIVQSIINSNGYMLNLKQWKSSNGLAYFEFRDNDNKAAYNYLTDMNHLMGFTFGCNAFSAGVTVDGNQLIVDKSIMGTLIGGCGSTEDELNNALKGENMLNYDAKANRLTITTHNSYRFIMEGKLLPKPTLPTLQDLQNYEWRSVSTKVLPQSDVPWIESPWTKFEKGSKLQFYNQQIRYTVGCNQISHHFEMTPKGIKTLGYSTSTKMACSDLMQAETLLTQLMTGDMQLNILKMNAENAVLYQTNADGRELIWLGKLKQAN